MTSYNDMVTVLVLINSTQSDALGILVTWIQVGHKTCHILIAGVLVLVRTI